jgi:hypothetical protein
MRKSRKPFKFVTRVIDRFRDSCVNSREFSISFGLHAIFVALFGTMILFHVGDGASRFESGADGFLGSSGESGPPQQNTTDLPPLENVAVMAAPVNNFKAITTMAISPVSFNMEQMFTSTHTRESGGKAGGWGKSSAGKGAWGNGFGTKSKDDLMLVGTFFDLKQTQTGKPLPTTHADWVKVIDGFVKSGMNHAVCAKYFHAGPIYTSHFCIPVQSAIEGPAHFGLQGMVKPTKWFIHYRGGFSPPRTGLYRFWGRGDDVLMVFVNRARVLLVGEQYVYYFINPPTWTLGRVPYPGSWVMLSQGVTYRLDVIMGECPGGLFESQLLIEEKSANKIGADDRYHPLPVFSTLPIEGKPPRSQHYEVENEPLVMSPLKSVLDLRNQ